MSAMEKMAFDFIVKMLGITPEKAKEGVNWAYGSIRGFDSRLKRVEEQQAEILSLLKQGKIEECPTKISPLRLIAEL
jgi:hypothetical protein